VKIIHKKGAYCKSYLPADTAVTSSTLGTFFLPPQRAVFLKFVKQTAAVPWHDLRRSEAADVRCSVKYAEKYGKSVQILMQIELLWKL
jgi:hypothetical protein